MSSTFTINPKVIDISHHNTLDSKDLVSSFQKAYDFGIRGVIHKATQGTGNVDQTYLDRRDAALQVGLLWGAYHFADNSDVDAQVKHFLDTVDPDDKTLVALDYEPNGNSTMDIDQAEAFLKAVETRLGRKAVLYSGNLIKETLDGTDDYFGAHRLWLCQYSLANPPKFVLPAAWDKYWIIQYTGDGIGPKPHMIPGFKDKGLDINSYDGTDEQLAAEWSGAAPAVA